MNIWNEVAAPTTCALVTIWPAVSYTTPEPRPDAVLISTTDGSTRRIVLT
jgi:hypothetical protein